MRTKLFILLFLLVSGTTQAQVFEPGEEARTVRTGGFWDNWFVQMDLDMSLQNPYGYNFADVFPNGKSFGLDVAAGKWFSHQIGYRLKFNWENALPLLENGHANWLAPFYQPGVNRDKGGYVAFYMDALLNMHNLFGSYRADRTWNMSLYPRIGVNYNYGVSKGALVAGVGVLNTYRLSNRWSVYADVAYMMTGSGFVGKEHVEGTGTGSNSNGYFSIGLGAQYDLGVIDKGKRKNDKPESEHVLTNGIWDNWFVQAGADMSLINPYGCNFSDVIPKGMTFGLNAAFGKWFSPDFGLKARVQWDNGLIENKNLEWLPPKDDPRQNYKEGGLATFALDAMLNFTNAFAGYQPERKWHTSGYIRAGIITQFVEGSASPLFGGGLQETYRLNDKWSLFGSLGYQVSTSEGMGYGSTGMQVATGSNGFFDIDFGVVLDIGENRFYRSTAEKRAEAKPAGKHNWSRFVVNTAASVGVGWALKTGIKAVVKEDRPDHSDDESFPSGHATMAFAAATSLHKEFGKEAWWVSALGFSAATAVAVERVASDRHHWYDVVAGAALGYGSAELTWWLSDKVFKTDKVGVGFSGNTVDVAVKL